MKTFTFAAFLSFLLFAAANLQAQNRKGEIQGMIKDAESGEILPYASIFFEGTTTGALSDDKGFYSLKGIQPGAYKLKVTYVGYSDTTIAIEITGDEVLVRNFELVFKSTLGEAVIVTAQAYGQIKAINTQINAQTIKNVVSEQKIRELPDANAAEALSRLPGVSIIRDGGEAVAVRIRGVDANTVYVNGMPMVGGLGGVSSAMIGSIELNKAFMPDQDANILGGSVDFKIREAPSGFKKDIWLRTGYNGFTRSFKMHDASLSLSNRFLKDKLGVMLSLSYDRKDRSRDSYNVSYEHVGSSTNSYEIKPVQISGVILNHSENLNDRMGVTLFTDYKLNNGRIFYHGFFSFLDQDNANAENNYTNTAEINYQSDQFKSNERNILNGIGGEHSLAGMKIDWGVFMSRSKSARPNGLRYDAGNANGMTGVITIDSTTTIQEFLALGNNDITKTYAGYIFKYNDESFTDELGYKLNIEVPFSLGKKIDGFIKFGGKIRNIKRGYDYNEVYSDFRDDSSQKLWRDAIQRMPDYGWTYIPNGWLGHDAFSSDQQVQDFSLEGAKTYFFPDFDKVAYVEGKLDDLLGPTLFAQRNDYTNNEQYYAGYVMAGIDIGEMITFTPGVRYEKNVYETTARWLEETIHYGPLGSQGELKDTTDGNHRDNFFPMLHLKIKPVKWFDIRLAYTKTVSRPSFTKMSPKSYRSPLYDLTVGDPDLKPQSNTNYDIYLSFYTGRLGLFTAGAFYKTMEDQVLDYQVRIIDPEDYGLSDSYSDRNMNYPLNNKWPGYITGLEIDWQTQFSYLPKPFNGITLNANVSFMKSETRYPFYVFETVVIPTPPYRETQGREDSRISKIYGMPDMVGNLALGYEMGGFSGRISAYYQSYTVNSVIPSDISIDTDKDDYLKIDVQLSQKINKIKGMTLYLNINNLTNNTDRIILANYRDRITSEEKYGIAGDIGIRYQF